MLLSPPPFGEKIADHFVWSMKAGDDAVPWPAPLSIIDTLKEANAFTRDIFPANEVSVAYVAYTNTWNWEEVSQLSLTPDGLLAGLFFPFYLHHWQPDDDEVSSPEHAGKSATELFLLHRGRTIASFGRSYLEECVSTPYSFFEVLEARTEGVRLRDLLSGESFMASVREPDESLSYGQILYGLVVRLNDFAFVEAGPPYALPISVRPHLYALIESASVPGWSAREVAWQSQELFREFYIERLAYLLTTPGEADVAKSRKLHREMRFWTRSTNEALQSMQHLAIEGDGGSKNRRTGRGKVKAKAGAAFRWRAPTPAPAEPDGLVQLQDDRMSCWTQTTRAAKFFLEFMADQEPRVALYRGCSDFE